MWYLQGHAQVYGRIFSTIREMGNHWKVFSKEEGHDLVFQNECLGCFMQNDLEEGSHGHK